MSKTVVIVRSGGKITNIYKIQEQVIFADSVRHHSFIEFMDKNERKIRISGDITVIEFNRGDENEWDKFSEYHVIVDSWRCID